MVIYDLHEYDEDNDFHVSWCLFDVLSEALEERDRLNEDGSDFVVVKRNMGQLDLHQFKPYMDWEDVKPDSRSAE